MVVLEVTGMDEAYDEFWEELLRDAESSGDPQHACFFRTYAELAAENGDCADLVYTPARKDGPRGYQVDGYALDAERGELHLAICDFRSDVELQSLNQAPIEQLYKKAERFVTAAMDPEFINALEETSPAFEAAYPVYSFRDDIKRVRVIIFSNAKLASRKTGVGAKEVGGLTFTHNLLDFSRYLDICGSRNGSEPIELDLAELNGGPIPCLHAHAASSRYASYLIALPAELLAKIYGLYGARLLEQNVRTFLQARTKVNRGILQTIKSYPEMFFAYNNGITATASEITTKRLADGTTSIESVKNLQIVNGGQTTASILYAKDKDGADLGEIYVQMKLSVIDPEDIEDIVPKISRYANTQNRISESDFFSSHPYHLEMERISRRLTAPQRPGAFSATKWFYERARGQYKDQLAYGTVAKRKRFLTEYPKDQVVVKTDLAKYVLSMEAEPHIVSQGAQKCFLSFAEGIGKAWESNPDSFSEGYFKDVIADAIVFRWTDSMIGKSEWYRQDRGYKAQTVTYTIAWLVNFLAGIARSIDTQRIWEDQDLPEGLKLALEHCAPRVAERIKAAPAEIKNIGEYCKRPACWAAVMALDIAVPGDIGTWTVDAKEKRKRKREGRETKGLRDGIDFDSRILELQPQASEIRAFAKSKRLLSPRASAALDKLSRADVSFTKAEKNGLKFLFERMTQAGFRFNA